MKHLKNLNKLKTLKLNSHLDKLKKNKALNKNNGATMQTTTNWHKNQVLNPPHTNMYYDASDNTDQLKNIKENI